MAGCWRRRQKARSSRLLMAERATTATYILSKLDSAVATKVIAALPRDRRNAALCGLVAPLDVTPLAARVIEEAVGSALKQAPKAAADVEGRSRLAGIINGLDPPEAEDAMRALEQASPKDAAIVKTMLFSFNDLPRLSERARALLFDRASIDIVVMALRGTDADFRDSVLSSMPSRGRRLVEGELSSGANRAASRHRQGAQGHRRNRARHGESQRDRAWRAAAGRSGLSLEAAAKTAGRAAGER